MNFGGVFAQKSGMSRIFDKNGNHIPVTILSVYDAEVIELKKEDIHGYNALVIGFEEVIKRKLKKPQLSYFTKNNLPLFNKIRELRTSLENFKRGDIINLAQFNVGEYVDVTSISKGKGFAGVMKRHNFGGLRASHGVSITHRSHGSTGNMRREGRVLKGKKMAGQLGNKQVTIQNLKIVDIDIEKKILIIKGAVPGFNGSIIKIMNSIKKNKKFI